MWALHHLLDLRARPADVRALELEGVALDEDLRYIGDMGEICARCGGDVGRYYPYPSRNP